MEFYEEVLNTMDVDDTVAPCVNILRPEFKSYQEQALHDYLQHFRKVEPETFYRDVFPKGTLADAVAQEKGKYAGRVYWNGELSKYVNDDLQAVLTEASNESGKINYIAYAGNGETNELARELYAFVFRITLPEEIYPHYVLQSLDRLEWVFDKYGCGHSRTPRICPTYVLADDTYKHVWFCYVMREPIPMFYHLHKKIQRLYDALSRAIYKLWDNGYWDDIQQRYVYVYECKKPMPKSIFQAYPVVGSKLGRREISAYLTGQKYSLGELNALVPKVSQVELYDPKMTLEEAEEKYEAWHLRRIVQHRKASKRRTFTVKPEVYQWYVNKHVMENQDIVQLGAMEALAAYAAKASICKEAFLEDLDKIQGILMARFSQKDILEHKFRAIDYYDTIPEPLHYVSTETVSEWTGVTINPNKRNYLPQKQHLKNLHDSQSYEKRILEWVKNNPGGRITQCSRELAISRQTVSKWWPGREKKVPAKNPCPLCGAEMVKIKIKPHYWAQKGKYYMRTDKECPKCHLYLEGRSRVTQRPAE